MMKVLSVLFLLAMCSQPELVFIPPPIPVIEDEKMLNNVLKIEFAPDALEIAYAYKQFWSTRIKLLVLEHLVDVARYEEAIELGNELLLIDVKTNVPAKKVVKKTANKIVVSNTSIRKKTTVKKTVSRPKKTTTRVKSTPKIVKETLSESQWHKIAFYLAMAHWGLGHASEANEFFAKTRERPNYFYLYRYAQFVAEQKDWQKALSLFEESYSRSNGKFEYINQAYARFLVDYAVEIKAKNALMADQLLIKVLADERLAITPAAAKAKIWWKQFQPLFTERASLRTPAFLPALPNP
ncbi:MAG: hypothetical protein ACRCY4_08700 [Brevinema sp.]